MAERVYRPVIAVAHGLFRALDLQFTIRGLEHVPAGGAAVLAPNHVSYLDFMFVGEVGVRGGRLVRFLAKESVFRHPVGGPLMRGMHHIPVDRAAGAGAFRAAIDALGRGEVLGIFPEQTISRSFVPRPMKRGAARLSLEAGVPLLPVVTWGGQRVWTVGRRPRPTRHVPVTLTVGPPLPPRAGDDPATLTARLAETLRAMVQTAVADYPPPGHPAGTWWWPAHAGGAAPTPEQAAEAEAHSIHGRHRAS